MDMDMDMNKSALQNQTVLSQSQMKLCDTQVPDDYVCFISLLHIHITFQFISIFRSLTFNFVKTVNVSVAKHPLNIHSNQITIKCLLQKTLITCKSFRKTMTLTIMILIISAIIMIIIIKTITKKTQILSMMMMVGILISAMMMNGAIIHNKIQAIQTENNSFNN